MDLLPENARKIKIFKSLRQAYGQNSLNDQYKVVKQQYVGKYADKRNNKSISEIDNPIHY